MRTTPWFSWREKPSREGWYDYRGNGIEGTCLLYWNGLEWGYFAPFGWVAMAEDSEDQWRGLAEQAGKQE